MKIRVFKISKLLSKALQNTTTEIEKQRYCAHENTATMNSRYFELIMKVKIRLI